MKVYGKVPNEIPPGYISGVFVFDQRSRERINAVVDRAGDFTVEMHTTMFLPEGRVFPPSLGHFFVRPAGAFRAAADSDSEGDDPAEVCPLVRLVGP